jgi:HPt (histidine-containing phosphotransfer) domain-containing protein
MDDYLAKPVRIADLKQKIDYWCHSEAAGPGGTPLTESPQVDDAGAKPANDAGAPAAIEPSALDELREVMGDDLEELIDAYLDDTTRRLDELERAVDREPEVLVQVAHTLKGSSANVGARHFSERCSEVHQRAKQDASDPALRELITALGHEFARVRSALESYRAGL